MLFNPFIGPLTGYHRPGPVFPVDQERLVRDKVNDIISVIPEHKLDRQESGIPDVESKCLFCFFPVIIRGGAEFQPVDVHRIR